MAIKTAEKLPGMLPAILTASAAWGRRAPAACRPACRVSSGRSAVATAFLLFGILASARPLHSATLAERMRAGDPAPLVDELARLGRTIDLSKPGLIREAIGDLRGIPAERDQRNGTGEPAFTRYGFPAGDIIYNPDIGSQYFLLISLHSCVPVQMIRERLRSPEFLQPASRITVALYTDAPYRDRLLNAFTYLDDVSGCVANFGLSQWKYDPWHIH